MLGSEASMKVFDRDLQATSERSETHYRTLSTSSDKS